MRQLSQHIALGLCLVSLALCLAPPAEAAWGIGKCSQDRTHDWQVFERYLRGLQPDDPDYLPHPFPRTPEQVVTDFVFQYLEIWSTDDPSRIPLEDRELLSLLREGKVEFDFLRVEDWSPQRCGAQGPHDYYWLILILEKISTFEKATVAVRRDGRIAAMQMKSTKPGERQQIGKTEEIASKLAETAAELGLQVLEPQYVTTWGTLRCPLLEPCIAFRSGSQELIFREGEVYALHRSRRFAGQEDFATPEAQAIVIERSALAAQKGELVISVGETYVTANHARRQRP